MKKHPAQLALAATLTALAGNADAATASTQGGLTVRSDDGNFEGKLGGRLHYDYTSLSEDQIEDASDGFHLRRAYLTLSGKVYSFEYKLETDLASSEASSRDMWIGHELLGGFAKAGHMQPAYGMALLTSSNDVLFAERPFISNRVVFTDRLYQNGLSYAYAARGFTAMAMYYNVSPDADDDASVSSEGDGQSLRLTYAPIRRDGVLLHLGASYDYADFEQTEDEPSPLVEAPYVARRGPSLSLVEEGYDEQQTATLELAGAFGAVFMQAEYALARFEGGAAQDQDLSAFYVQAGWFVSGQRKPYDGEKGVFATPDEATGAIELKARYDYAKNEDAAGEPEARVISLGVNYYFHPKVRFMLDYNIGKGEVDGFSDDPSALVARAQLSF